MVTEYIATGEPVGSRKLARRYGLNLSPASIRNVLSDLEEYGYVSQPHTSAGRVPTDSGFRLFVDALVQMREVTAEDRAAVEQRLRDLRPGQDDVLREVGKLLSAMTNTVSVVSPPRPEREELAQLRFMPVRKGQVLAVIVTRSGTVQNRIIHLPDGMDVEGLEKIHNRLSDLLDGRTLTEIRDELAKDMQAEQTQYVQLTQATREIVDATLSSQSEADVVITGQRRLFGRPEFESAEKIRAYLRTFEEKQDLLEMLDRTLTAGGVQVLIGSETNLVDIEDISVITASFQQGGSSPGTVGIIGPTRMDYGKVVPLVQYTARLMSEILDADDEDRNDA